MFTAPPPSSAPRRHALGPVACAATVTAVCLLTGGCASGPKNFVNDNDRLRRENLELDRKVQALETALERRDQQVRTLESRLSSSAADVDADLPVLSQVTLGRYSGPVDTDDDGRIDALRLYVQTRDAQGRFLVTAATVTVQIVALQADASPRVLAEKTFTAAAFDAAYRSGFMGTHHTLDVPLPAVERPSTLTAVLALTDAASGVRLETQQTFDLP